MASSTKLAMCFTFQHGEQEQEQEERLDRLQSRASISGKAGDSSTLLLGDDPGLDAKLSEEREVVRLLQLLRRLGDSPHSLPDGGFFGPASSSPLIPFFITSSGIALLLLVL